MEWYLNNNTLTNNNISHNEIGLEIRYSSQHNLVYNNVFYSNNQIGINMYSYYNTLYHNKFIINTKHASDSGKNFWNATYPQGGNYWDNYSGADVKSGPSQNESGSDYIGDTPYTINTDSFDNYPLMKWPREDLELPIIKLISPSNNSFIKSGININLSISDSNLNEVTCSINDGPHETLSSPFEINTVGWNDGNYIIEIHAIDTFENENISWYNFTFDSSSPDILLNSPQNNTFIKGEIDLSITDANLNQTSYSINNGPTYSLTEPYNIDTSEWPDDDYNVTIYADDLAGNINQKWVMFTKDTVLPEITLNSPENESMIIGIMILDFEVSDANLDSVSYSINLGTFQTFEDPYNLDTMEWDDGIYVITIKAEDAASHITEQWFIFRFDLSTPFIESASINDNAQDIDVGTDIVFEFSEPMECDTVESALSIDPYTDYSCSWNSDNTTLTIAFSEPLEYDTLYKVSISIQASDMAGKGLEDKFELEFTTAQKSKEKGGEEFSVMYLLLMIIIAVVVIVLIVVIAMAKKKKHFRK